MRNVVGGTESVGCITVCCCVCLYVQSDKDRANFNKLMSTVKKSGKVEPFDILINL